ncbi:carbohydrate ABC transporter permease [Mesobacillus maritimus]|uniref:Sugar ABC transporter permease n=1 Tax=Mesobacillus maritimus TaxID=1643336 RepID=A0ABS7KAQ6_9BACI|nr:sugar ABC transporter permease [Mesobacillus maritimus]MBY0099337.1 sugar ABC transporter permease [Mesobacillus maritimus]
MNKVMSNKWVIAMYVLPALLLILVLIYVPIILTGYYGLMKWDGIGEMDFIGLSNYTKLLTDDDFWQSSLNSLLLAIFSLLSLIGYLAISLVLAAKIKGADLLRKIYLIPMLLSSVAIAQLWLKIYHPSNGLLNSLLVFFGVDNPPAWLAEPNLVLGAIFVPIIWQYAGFYILIYYAALKNIPDSVIEAAKIDGASPLQIAYKIKLPLIMGVIKVTIVLSFVGSLKYFDLIYVMTGGGPNGASEVIASYMYKQAFNSYNFGYGSAVGFALLLFCLLATVVIQRLTRTDDEVEY